MTIRELIDHLIDLPDRDLDVCIMTDTGWGPLESISHMDVTDTHRVLILSPEDES